jgi:ABC-type anion transport system duplicated permease subunit
VNQREIMYDELYRMIDLVPMGKDIIMFFLFCIKYFFRSLTNQFSSTRKINNADQAEQVRELTKQMRSSDFRERLNGIEEFQKLCELETDTAVQCLVQIFDGFNECLADMNSKVVLKALNTMHQLVPILGDALSTVISSALPIVAQNIASKNREISQLASDIIDTAIEYIGKKTFKLNGDFCI